MAAGSGIGASRRAWDALPADVRADVEAAARRREPADDPRTAAAAVAYVRSQTGRRSWFTVVVLLYPLVIVGGMLANIIGGLDKDVAVALMLVVLGPLGVLTFVRMPRMFAAKRLLLANLGLAAESEFELPERYRIGSRHPQVGPAIVVGIMAVGAVALPVFNRGQVSSWLAAVMGTIMIAAYAEIGPAAIDAHSAVLDRDGITLPLAGVRLPWSSVRSPHISAQGRFAFTIVGEAESSGRLRRRWAERGRQRTRRGATIAIRTSRPELALAYATGASVRSRR